MTDFKLMTVEEFRKWLFNTYFKRTINLIQIHHTYLPDYNAFQKVPDHLLHCRQMENYQTKVREPRFDSIGQNLTIFPDGKVVLCRPFDVAPAGIKGANSHGICIEIVGNFDEGKDVMTAEQREAVLKVVGSLCSRFVIPVDTTNIGYHHWWDLKSGVRTNGKGKVKSCPGSGFFGGNSVEAAEKNFIPSVLEAMK